MTILVPGRLVARLRPVDLPRIVTTRPRSRRWRCSAGRLLPGVRDSRAQVEPATNRALAEERSVRLARRTSHSGPRRETGAVRRSSRRFASEGHRLPLGGSAARPVSARRVPEPTGELRRPRRAEAWRNYGQVRHPDPPVSQAMELALRRGSKCSLAAGREGPPPPREDVRDSRRRRRAPRRVRAEAELRCASAGPAQWRRENERAASATARVGCPVIGAVCAQGMGIALRTSNRRNRPAREWQSTTLGFGQTETTRAPTDYHRKIRCSVLSSEEGKVLSLMIS